MCVCVCVCVCTVEVSQMETKSNHNIRRQIRPLTDAESYRGPEVFTSLSVPVSMSLASGEELLSLSYLPPAHCHLPTPG